MRNHIPNHAEASADASTPEVYSEIHERILRIMENLLSSTRDTRLDRLLKGPAEFPVGNPRMALFSYLKEAFVIVEDGHVHVGQVVPEMSPYMEHIFEAAAKIDVVYEFGGVQLYTPAIIGPFVEAASDTVLWHLKEDHPNSIREVSFYHLENDRVVKFCTKPAEGHLNLE